MSFARLSPQPRAVALLKADLESGRVAESYLFTGPEGSGKRAAALELAKALNCRKGEPASDEGTGDMFGPAPAPVKAASEPCDACVSCRKIEEGTHPDVFVLDFDSQARLLDVKEEDKGKQKELKIEVVRQLISQSFKTPLEGRMKALIIDGAEHLSTESANALLKVLEESPRLCVWVLLTASSERLLPTVRSRCRKVSFAPLEVSARIAAPAPKAAAGAQKKYRAKEPAESLEELAGRLFPLGQGPAPLEFSARVMSLARKGGQRRHAELFLREVTLKMAEELRRTPTPQLADKLDRVLEAQGDLRRNVSPQLVLDSLFLSLR